MIPVLDKASIENAIHCLATLLYLGKRQKEIKERMQRLAHIGLRLELKDAVNNCTLINDSYNSDLLSLKIALDLLQQQKQHSQKDIDPFRHPSIREK